MNTTNKMATMKMPRLIMNMSLPLMLSLLIQSLYNIVDSIFVARISESALTATSLAYPIQILMIAVSVGTSVGINALLSRSVGAKEYEMTTNAATTGVLLAIAGTIVFLLLGLFCPEWFASMFTDDETIALYCSQYLRICMVFCLGTFISTMYQRFLQAVGYTFESMLSLVAGAVTNLILDPILIFGLLGAPALGIRGAAIATVIGQWVSAAVAILLNRIRNPLIRVKFGGYRPDKKVFLQIYRVGLPTIVTQAIGSIMLTAVNAILMPFSATAVAFFGVYYKLQNFLFMPMNGLGQAAIPIVGYNYGAKNPDRIRQLYKNILPIAVVFSVAATIVFLALPGPLLSLFSASEEMLALGIPALRIISVTFVFASVTMVLGYSASGMGNGIVNMLGTAIRQLILLVPVLYLFSRFFGISHAWYAFWIAEAVATLYAVIATVHELNKKKIISRQKMQS